MKFLILTKDDFNKQIFSTLCPYLVECLRKRGHEVEVNYCNKDIIYKTGEFDYYMWLMYPEHLKGIEKDRWGTPMPDAQTWWRPKNCSDFFLSRDVEKTIFYWIMGSILEKNGIDVGNVFSSLHGDNKPHMDRWVPPSFVLDRDKTSEMSIALDIDERNFNHCRETIEEIKKLDVNVNLIGNVPEGVTLGERFTVYGKGTDKSTMVNIFKDSWLYISAISSSYEISVIESQVAGCYVLSVEGHVIRELFNDSTGEEVDLKNLCSRIQYLCKNKPNFKNISEIAWNKHNLDNFIDEDFLLKLR